MEMANDDLGVRYVVTQNPSGSSGSFSAPGCESWNSFLYLINTTGIWGDVDGISGPDVTYSVSGGIVTWNSNSPLSGEVFFVVFLYK